jgi:homogentisate 1,2-dioxygenase
MAFMLESRWVIRPTAWAMTTPLLQGDYDQCWQGFTPATLP